MRVVFERMADRRPVVTPLTRDDGVAFTLRGAGGGEDLPHDLVHLLVETELGVRDGIWGCIADGVVWGSMTHVSGRQPPQARPRSERLKKERRDAIGRAETLADAVARLSRGEAVPAQQVAWVPAAELHRAAAALREARSRWRALRPGETWDLEWRHPRGRS
ncbi:hypothetical protein [Klenkia taihuensis]|uniref:hypothetical protein n=1 Tax=Klenkia taihuensis TaxID=1225127 RepID=UPI000B80EA25|nr:hypothetical protein [Klenkia taihuensis]